MRKIALTAFGFIALLSLVGCDSDVRYSDKVKVTGTDNKSFSLTVPKEVTVRPGEATKVDVKIDRHGFDDAVTLNVSQLPEGVTMLESAPVTPKGQNTGNFTLQAADTANAEKGAEFKLSAHAAGVEAGPYQ